MFYSSLAFLVIALLAALWGFGVLGGSAAIAAKICFIVFLALFFISTSRDSSRDL